MEECRLRAVDDELHRQGAENDAQHAVDDVDAGDPQMGGQTARDAQAEEGAEKHRTRGGEAS